LECFVFTSGHTLSHRADKDQVFILVDRHHSADKKEAAVVVALRVSASLPRLKTGPLGQPICVVAYPWGRNIALVGGIVSQVNLDPPGDRATAPRFIVDASVSYGSSGGGVYDADGRLVGVVEGDRTARGAFEGDAPHQSFTVPVPGETYVVPLADIRRFLHEVDPVPSDRAGVLFP
jgi:S1-C subfamily serine protease